MSMRVDPTMLHAWLTARSLARGLPAPVADHGGFRVDTNSDAEIRRWVFPHMVDGLVELARTINAPGHLLKLCGTEDELRSALPAGWRLHSQAYFMSAGQSGVERPLPSGYDIAADRDGAVTAVRIRAGDGELAASGYAAEADGVFVYDRIVTAAAHRRKGLGGALMTALRREKQNRQAPELLVASEDGRALYASLGWRTISPYNTASVAEI
jgi:GNAT superfamily N-acetyltransferase